MTMEGYIDKTCPFCKTAITEEDSVKICPVCGIPHHQECWEENSGCTTFECSEQHYKPQDGAESDVCEKCGASMNKGQAFCSRCGAPKRVPAQNACTECGATLQDGQAFCPVCGHKVGLTVDPRVTASIGKINAVSKRKKTLIIGIASAAVLIIVILLLVLAKGNKKDFNIMYASIADEYWCTISNDGSYMEIDTNPYDIDDEIEMSAYNQLAIINSDLGFSDALYSKMGQTTSLDGWQTMSNDKVTVSWKYHPNNGLEVFYEWDSN